MSVEIRWPEYVYFLYSMIIHHDVAIRSSGLHKTKRSHLTWAQFPESIASMDRKEKDLRAERDFLKGQLSECR